MDDGIKAIVSKKKIVILSGTTCAMLGSNGHCPFQLNPQISMIKKISRHTTFCAANKNSTSCCTSLHISHCSLRICTFPPTFLFHHIHVNVHLSVPKGNHLCHSYSNLTQRLSSPTHLILDVHINTRGPDLQFYMYM